MTMPASFDRYGDPTPLSPVILSVPHAGRHYPPALVAALRVPVAALRPLEDRHVDVVAMAARGTTTTFVQRLPRAWIDLNRAEHERDPAIDSGADAKLLPAASAKLRGGLGLVPRRVTEVGEIWRRRLAGEDVAARILHAHRPYHAALAGALAAARDRFGVAVLIDVHSMPPLDGAGAARVVIGDRFGRAATPRLVHRLHGAVTAAGHACALNAPYAGAHLLTVHGRPAANIHAVQIEFDRTLYLDAALDQPGDGLSTTAALLRAMIDAASDEALAMVAAAALAAE